MVMKGTVPEKIMRAMRWEGHDGDDGEERDFDDVYDDGNEVGTAWWWRALWLRITMLMLLVINFVMVMLIFLNVNYGGEGHCAWKDHEKVMI